MGLERFAIIVVVACGGGGESAPVVCGQGEMFDIAGPEDLDELFGCTELAGSLRFGDTQLAAIDGLEALRVVDGTVNLFRNPNLVDLSGLRNLEIVRGELLVHHNDVLASAQLPSVRVCGELLVSNNASLSELGLNDLATVEGDLRILGNRSLPQADAEAFAAGVDVGRTVLVEDNL
jgi:hypothetical protein